ncbi:uncharacterized protein [Nicotiana tomentosiformis]|uniref:uncharacterized protein n=1 Tax=Nicotiana tomentosiformis TaxID=4098 RepID=UPI00388CC932
MFRLDNGSECFNNTCKDLFQLHGIVHQLSFPYTPQRNGVVERRHRHILETVRAIRFQGHLLIRYWEHCIDTVVYIINKIPSFVLAHISLYEFVFGKAPSLTHLRQELPSSTEYDNIVTTSNSPTIPLAEETRKLARVFKPPIWLKDYVRPDKMKSGGLTEEVYMIIPQGFNGSSDKSAVCKLLKSLYRLKKVPRQWNLKLTSALVAAGFQQSHLDYSLFIRKTADHMVVVYVYDLLIIGDSITLIQ